MMNNSPFVASSVAMLLLVFSQASPAQEGGSAPQKNQLGDFLSVAGMCLPPAGTESSGSPGVGAIETAQGGFSGSASTPGDHSGTARSASPGAGARPLGLGSGGLQTALRSPKDTSHEDQSDPDLDAESNSPWSVGTTKPELTVASKAVADSVGSPTKSKTLDGAFDWPNLFVGDSGLLTALRERLLDRYKPGASQGVGQQYATPGAGQGVGQQYATQQPTSPATAGLQSPQASDPLGAGPAAIAETSLVQLAEEVAENSSLNVSEEPPVSALEAVVQEQHSLLSDPAGSSPGVATTGLVGSGFFPAAVSEPAALSLLSMGLLGLVGWRRRQGLSGWGRNQA